MSTPGAFFEPLDAADPGPRDVREHVARQAELTVRIVAPRGWLDVGWRSGTALEASDEEQHEADEAEHPFPRLDSGEARNGYQDRKNGRHGKA